MNKTSISWTGTYQSDGVLKPGYTSNPIRARNRETGRVGHFCERVSPGCAHCWSSQLNETAYRVGTGLSFLPANREKVELYLDERELHEWSKPRYRGAKCFAFDMTDLFGEWVPDEWLDMIFAAMAHAPDVKFQILTKRPERMREYVQSQGTGLDVEDAFCAYDDGREHNFAWPLPNVWLGVSVENQHWADERIPILLDTPAAVRFISAEPLLGSVHLEPWLPFNVKMDYHAARGALKWGHPPKLSWVIVGAESGPKRRPFDNAWARSILQQCREAGVACWLKQGPGFKSEQPFGAPELDGVREFPETAVSR